MAFVPRSLGSDRSLVPLYRPSDLLSCRAVFSLILRECVRKFRADGVTVIVAYELRSFAFAAAIAAASAGLFKAIEVTTTAVGPDGVEVPVSASASTSAGIKTATISDSESMLSGKTLVLRVEGLHSRDVAMVLCDVTKSGATMSQIASLMQGRVTKVLTSALINVREPQEGLLFSLTT
jgi:adenine/guanine phosphoribosyltransferase-like PRPP-binding protein